MGGNGVGGRAPLMTCDKHKTAVHGIITEGLGGRDIMMLKSLKEKIDPRAGDAGVE